MNAENKDVIAKPVIVSVNVSRVNGPHKTVRSASEKNKIGIRSMIMI
jgi:hypothetical protein